MGFQTSLTWKIFTLSANIDMRLGGIFYSRTYRYMQSDAALARQENVGIPIPAKYANNIPAYLKSNPNAFIKVTGFQYFHLVGGPNAAKGGFNYNTNGNIYFPDGAFYPGVYSPWSFARMDMFDASYIKLRELSIATQLPKKLASALKLQGISVSVYTRNIILWTKAKAGVDPEQAFRYQPGPQGNGSQFSQGVEYYNINPWTLPIGIKLNVRF